VDLQITRFTNNARLVKRGVAARGVYHWNCARAYTLLAIHAQP